MGAQKSSESTSYSGSGQKWANPFALRGVNASFDTFRGAQPNLDRAVSSTGNIRDQMEARFGSSAATNGQAQGYLGDVLSGKFMNSNPYLNDVISASRSGIQDGVNSNFAGAGRYGSGAHEGVMARELGNMESGMRMSDYNSQMSRMDQAAGMAMQGNQADGSQALAANGMAAELPYTGTNNLSQQLAALFNGGNSRSVSYAPNPIWGAIGAGLGAAGMAAGSDRRLKKDIVELGIRPDGLTAFEWTYRHDPDQARYQGVMADEVKVKRPEAYIENYNGTGYAGVNYAALGTPMQRVPA